MTVPASLSKWAHPPRSNTPRSSSSGPPGACITPSTETCVVVVSFMVRPFSRVQVSGVTTVLRCWYFTLTSYLTQPEGKERDEKQRMVGHLQRLSHERLWTNHRSVWTTYEIDPYQALAHSWCIRLTGPHGRFSPR